MTDTDRNWPDWLLDDVAGRHAEARRTLQRLRRDAHESFWWGTDGLLAEAWAGVRRRLSAGADRAVGSAMADGAGAGNDAIAGGSPCRT